MNPLFPNMSEIEYFTYTVLRTIGKERQPKWLTNLGVRVQPKIKVN